jgi:hypothetical protein
VEIQCVETLIRIGGLCCVAFINLIVVVAGVRRQRLSVFVGPN